jgi:hypothetical protein
MRLAIAVIHRIDPPHDNHVSTLYLLPLLSVQHFISLVSFLLRATPSDDAEPRGLDLYRDQRLARRHQSLWANYYVEADGQGSRVR